MIIKANESHKEQIISLWSDAFRDKKEDVEKYLDTLLKYFLVYEEDGIVKGMLSVLPVTLHDKKGGYIYAVVTHPGYRSRGICRALMESVKQDTEYDFLVLVPQNKGLFAFYDKMDFTEVSFLKKDEASVSEEAESYVLKTLTAKEYESKRNEFYKDKNFIQWNDDILEFAKNMYGGSFLEIFENGKSVGVAFLYAEKEKVFIKELLCENHREVAEKIGGVLKAEKVNFVYESKYAEPTFMVFPKAYSGTKFGIYLD